MSWRRARFVTSHFRQFKSSTVSGKSPDLATKLAIWQHGFWLWRRVHVIGRREGNICLATDNSKIKKNKKSVLRISSRYVVSKVSHTNTVDKQFVNEDSTVCT